jgi:hypothetical protein
MVAINSQLVVSTYLPELEHVECKCAEATATNVIMTDSTGIPVLVEGIYLALIDFECQCHDLLSPNMSRISGYNGAETVCKVYVSKVFISHKAVVSTRDAKSITIDEVMLTRELPWPLPEALHHLVEHWDGVRVSEGTVGGPPTSILHSKSIQL